jgi:SPP1 family predicted phage head-tail adaptor
MPFRRRDPGINAGNMDRRVTLFAPVYNEPIEDEITGWKRITDVWAEFNPNFGHEVISAGRTVALGETNIIIRYRTDIDARWQIQYRGRTFKIGGIVNVLERNEQLSLNVQEVA